MFADSIYNRLAALLDCFQANLTLISFAALRAACEAPPEVSKADVVLAMIRVMLQRPVHPNRRCLPAL